MNLKDKLIRRLLDFGKKHRLMVYPTLALVAIISAVSHAVYWGKGNGKRLMASVMIVALLITQSLFLTSSAAGDDETALEENGSVASESDAVYDMELMTQNADVPVLYSQDDSITVKYLFVTKEQTLIAKELGSATVQKNDGGTYTVNLSTDKADLAFGDSSQSSNFTFSEWYTDISCTGTPLLGTSVELSEGDSSIVNGVYNVYFTATRTQYPLKIMDGDAQIKTAYIPVSGEQGVINPSVSYTVSNAAEYNAYKTGYKYAGLRYNGALYTETSNITIAPTGYVDAIAMSVDYEAYELPVTFDSQTASNSDKNIVVSGNSTITVDCTYGQTVTLPSSTMNDNVSSEAYYIAEWDINGTKYKPGTEINTAELFEAKSDLKEDPNIMSYTVKAVWEYKNVKLATADTDVVSIGDSAATITTTYGDTLSAGINAIYLTDEDGTKFNYSISDDDSRKLAQYGLSYSIGATSNQNNGVTFLSTNYVSDVTTGVTITLNVTDDNKSGDTFSFPITIVVNPRPISIVPESVKSSNGKDAPTKQYDGLTNIDVQGTASLDGVLSGDASNVNVTFEQSAELDSADAGTGKAITLSNVALNGTVANKYVIKGMADGSSRLTIDGIGTVEKRTLSIVMSLADGESDEIYFGENTPDYVLELTGDSVTKLSTADQSTYAAMDSTEFIRQYIGFTGYNTARTEYSNPGTYTISPAIDSTGKNYTVDASGLSQSFTVLRLDGKSEYILTGDLYGGYYKGLTISPTNGYTMIRRLAGGEDDIKEGTDPAAVKSLGWSSSISIEDMTNGTIRFQMMSASGAITKIVTLTGINVDTKGPVLQKVAVSPTSIKEYIKEFGFGSYYHSRDGIENINITVYYTSDESACKTLHYYFVDDSGVSGAETQVAFNSIKDGDYYVATFNIGTSLNQRGQLVVYADNEATNQSIRNKIKLDDFSDLSTDKGYYEWMIENNIESADIVVTTPDGQTAVTSDANSDIWYNGLNLSVDASDSESGVDKLIWSITTPDGVISPAPTETAGSVLGSIVNKADNYAKIYEYIFKYGISGDDMPAGSYTISAELEDNAGNTVTLPEAGPYNVDCKPSVIDVDAIADSEIYQSGVLMSFDVTEGANESGIASVELVKIDGNDEVSIKKWLPENDDERYAMALEYKIVSSGKYRIIATDNAGNVSTTDRTFNRLSNTVPDVPVITVDGIEGNNGWYKGEDSPNVSIDCKAFTSDNVKVTTYYKITTDGSSNQMPVPSNTEHIDFELTAQGEVTIEAWSVSEAGIESAHATKTIKVDTVSPTIEIINATIGDDGNMYINFRAKDSTSAIVTSRVFLNDIAIDVTEETNAVVGSFKAEGSKLYKLVVEDKAGNKSDEFTYQPLALNVAPVTNITTSGAYLEADIIGGTYDVNDYYIALKKHSDTSYRECLMNDSVTGKHININTTFRGLDANTVYDYKVYASNEKAEVKVYEGSFRTLSQRATGSVYGSVTYSDDVTHKDYPVYVSLYEANTVVASVRLDDADDTDYLFTNLSDGAYRIVATNGVLTKTAAVTISNGGVIYPDDYALNGGIKFILNGYNTSVVIEDDSINITADQLDSIYDNSVYKGILTDADIAVLEAGGSIDISLHASYIDVSDISSEEQSIFASKLADNAIIERYINLYVLKEVKDVNGEYVNNTPARIPELYNPVTISFPLGDLAGQKIYVASVHGEGSNYSFMNWANADDTVITNNYVTITTRYFSVYALYRIVPTDKTYQVTWKDGNGNTMKVETVKEGESATPPTETPVKNPTDKYEYVFSGWDSDYSSVTSDMVISATFGAREIGGNNGNNNGDNNGGNNGGNGNGVQAPGENSNTPTTRPNSYTYLGSADSPKTGDALPIVVVACMMLVSGAGVVVLRKVNK